VDQPSKDGIDDALSQLPEVAMIHVLACLECYGSKTRAHLPHRDRQETIAATVEE
jgi:hypothetical protein